LAKPIFSFWLNFCLLEKLVSFLAFFFPIGKTYIFSWLNFFFFDKTYIYSWLNYSFLAKPIFFLR
jgi:hypothetical protein